MSNVQKGGLRAALSRVFTNNKKASPSEPAKTFLVYSDETLVLTMVDEPGALISTAYTRRRKPVKHPFLSATAHAAEHESDLHDLLMRSSNMGEFQERLSEAGFRVELKEADDCDSSS